MKGFTIIVATDKQRGIGRGNQIPWHLSADLKHFKDITTADYIVGCKNVVIMGRKTWESLPVNVRPLPGRINAVLSTDVAYSLPEGVMRFGGLHDAIEYFCNTCERNFGEVFVIGGASVYAQAINDRRCLKIYQTKIDKEFGCDSFFPEIPDNFRESQKSATLKEQKIEFSFVEFSSYLIYK